MATNDSSALPTGNGNFLTRYWYDRSPVLRFLLAFVACVIVFYIVYYSDFYINHLSTPILAFQAKLSSGLLNLIGYGTSTAGETIRNDIFSVNIAKGCDGIEATALFIFAILVFPIAFKRKVPGLLAGIGVLFVVNIFRIAGLFLIGIHWNEAFDFMHLHGGLVMFTIAAVFLWIVWADWALKKERQAATVPSA